MTLLTKYAPPAPDLDRWENLSFSVGPADQARLTINLSDNLHGAFGLLTSIVDEVQLHESSLAAATLSAIGKHRQLFSSVAGMGNEREIGLYGELLILERLINLVGIETAVNSWQGPSSGQHDFVLEHVNLEVKTTSTQKRLHMMHGYYQLVPLAGSELYVLSIQLARGGTSGAVRLSELVERIRVLAGEFRHLLDEKLTKAGWHDADAMLYASAWSLRSEVQAYRVDDTFPVLTLNRLSASVPQINRISDLSYRVDLTNYPNCTLPGSLGNLTETSKEES
ncbi:PD-(D/E)XK motif protein [Rhodococcoides corynebacterioides]|uniref:PD-(D/E)XK motif protein n=1 Tax=Rhodococcoides corynebacterioides TaxID=53972 RepID=UPI001C9B83C4|nr:PD-(D/E)XK motif protein [Rhodococcus corynebacterioides]MBY6363257.1 PD-(D/E)XK motif protein [Rhodococcus corynebacterioides]